MRNIKIAALQFSCCSQVQENIDKAETMVREAASNGANLILLPELFERPYFCQEKRYDYYDYALPLTENPAVRRFQAVARELGVVIPVSFYERDVQRLFNSIAMIDADGSILGVYRKTHIPDDHFYQEKFYFTPGDTGFKVFETRFGTVGVGTCVGVVVGATVGVTVGIGCSSPTKSTRDILLPVFEWVSVNVSSPLQFSQSYIHTIT